MDKYMDMGIFKNLYWKSINRDCNIINLIEQLYIPVDFELDLDNMRIISFDLNYESNLCMYPYIISHTQSHRTQSHVQSHTKSYHTQTHTYSLNPIFNILKSKDIIKDF